MPQAPTFKQFTREVVGREQILHFLKMVKMRHGCPWEHAIRRRGFVFLSHVLQLRCLHEDCHGGSITSYLTALGNSLSRPKPPLFSLKRPCSRSRRCRFVNMRYQGKYRLWKCSRYNLTAPLKLPLAAPYAICISAISSFSKRAMVSTLCRGVNRFTNSKTNRCCSKGHISLQCTIWNT